MYGQETTWLKTSYNGNIRKNYAGIGYKYEKELDAFVPPKPFESWILEENSCQYVAPIPFPEGNQKTYFWDEKDKNWKEQDFILPTNSNI